MAYISEICKTLSNDVVDLNGFFGNYLTIIERVVIGENTVVLKGVRGDYKKEVLLVPVDMLDWFTCADLDDDYYYVAFKK